MSKAYQSEQLMTYLTPSQSSLFVISKLIHTYTHLVLPQKY